MMLDLLLAGAIWLLLRALLPLQRLLLCLLLSLFALRLLLLALGITVVVNLLHRLKLLLA